VSLDLPLLASQGESSHLKPNQGFSRAKKNHFFLLGSGRLAAHHKVGDSASMPVKVSQAQSRLVKAVLKKIFLAAP
jgi:hypothetical protein